MQEIDIRLNKLEYTATGNVTTSAQTLEEIFTSIPAVAKANMKTMVIHNVHTEDIYFGYTNGVTTSNGVPIVSIGNREFPMQNLELSPYFIVGASTADIRIEIWS